MSTEQVPVATQQFEAIANAIKASGIPVVAGGQDQLMSLLYNDTVAVPAYGGQHIFVGRDGQSLTELVKTKLATTHRHFQASNPAAQPPAGPTPRQQYDTIVAANPNMPEGERIVEAYRLGLIPHNPLMPGYAGLMAAKADPMAGRTDISKPFGLKRVK